jgi:hypothetical protein
MDRDELRDAIAGPAAKARCTVEPELVNNLVRDCEAQPSPLPLLQIVLAKLWEKKGAGGRLTQALYTEMSFEGAIDRHAEDVFDDLPDAQKEACLSLFLQLVEPLPDGRYLRRRVPLDTLMPLDRDPAAVKQVELLVGKLASWQARLISISREADAPVVEIAHEAIFQSWKRLAAWLAKNTEFLLWKKRLDVSVTDWRKNHDRNCCLTGNLLKQALLWLQQRGLDHTAEEKAFLLASLRRRRLRAGVWAGLAAAVIALVAGIAIWSNRKLTIEQLTGNARDFIKAKREIALIYALEASNRQAGETQSELLQLAVQTFSSPLLAYAEATPADRGFNDLVFSTDGVKIAAGGTEGALLWDLSSTAQRPESLLWGADHVQLPKPFSLAGNSGTRRVALSRDGKFLAAAADDQTADVWPTGPGGAAFNVTKQPAAITAIAVAGDGMHVLLGLDSNKMLWWNGATKKTDLTISTNSQVSDVALNADGSAVAAAQGDGTVRMWMLASGAAFGKALELELPTAAYVSYAADGKLLAAADSPGKAYLWRSPAGDAKRFDFHEPDQPVISASISADGRRLATLNHDQSISIWDTDGGKRVARFERSPDDFQKIAISGDGKHLAAALKNDPKIRIYELEWDALRQRAREVIADQSPKLANCASYVYLTPSVCKASLPEEKPR